MWIPLQVTGDNKPLTHWGRRGFCLIWSWWHMTTHSPKSQLTLRPHCPAFRQHVCSSAANLQLGFQVHRQNLKCPQVAISWNHNWAQRNASEQKTLVHRREPGGGVQGSPLSTRDTCVGIETAGATLRWERRFPQRPEHTEGNRNKSLSPRPSCVTVKLSLA